MMFYAHEVGLYFPEVCRNGIQMAKIHFLSGQVSQRINVIYSVMVIVVIDYFPVLNTPVSLAVDNDHSALTSANQPLVSHLFLLVFTLMSHLQCLSAESNENINAIWYIEMVKL